MGSMVLFITSINIRWECVSQTTIKHGPIILSMFVDSVRCTYIVHSWFHGIKLKRNDDVLLTITPRVFSLISRPQMNHFTFDVTGVTRAQNDTTDPCIATAGTRSFMNSGTISRTESYSSTIVTSFDVVQQPYSDVTTHV